MPSGHVNPKASLHSITQQPAAVSAGVEIKSFSDSSRQAPRSSPDHNGNGTAARSRRPSISAFAAAMTPSSPTSRMRAKFSNVHGHLPSVNVGGSDDSVAPAPPSGVLFPYTPMSSLPSSAVMQVAPQSAAGNRRPGLLSPGPSHFEKILADRAAASKHKHTNSVDSDNASLASFGCEGAVEFDRQYRNITNADLDPGVRERFLDGIFMKLTARAGKSGSQSRTSPGSANGRQGKVRALKPHFLDLTAIINPVPRDQRDTSVQTPSSTSSTSTADSPVSWDADVPQGVSPTGSTPLLRSRRSAESLADGRRRRKQSWFGANVAGVPPTSADMRVTQSAQEYSSSSHVPTLPEWAKKSNMSRCDLPKSQLDEPLSPISPLARSAQSNSQSAHQPKDTSTIRGPRAHGKVSGSHSRARSIHDALISANVAPALDANNVAMTRAASYDVNSGNGAPARGSQPRQEPMNHLHSLMHLDGPLQPGVVVPRSGLPSSSSSPKKDSRRGDENVSPNAARRFGE
ncbi:hypothetical protein CBOM_02584 [Ceraceosorus bombacis]|uniref:Uncharacterized protein n=1 Tax=Ceraceosorus bombacis TaxID=401625 RepID=A0A0N7L9U5_9BASI|nr:hypothetical protein CBOM_02584 [Ceraceosorus bombacis]